MTDMSDADIVGWATDEIRDLDELARSMIPGYQTLSSEDMEKLERLRRIQQEMEDDRR